MDMKQMVAGMANMKLSKRGKKRMFSQPSVAELGSGPDYPWGISLTLEDASLKKLGIEELPEAGEKCMIHAVGKVTRVSKSANEKKTDRSIDVQITKLALIHDEDGMAEGFASVDKEY